MLKHLESLDAPERFKELVHIIQTEPSDDFLRVKLKAIFKAYFVCVSRDLLEQCHGDDDKCIELIIQHRHDEKEIKLK